MEGLWFSLRPVTKNTVDYAGPFILVSVGGLDLWLETIEALAIRLSCGLILLSSVWVNHWALMLNGGVCRYVMSSSVEFWQRAWHRKVSLVKWIVLWSPFLWYREGGFIRVKAVMYSLRTRVLKLRTEQGEIRRKRRESGFSQNFVTFSLAYCSHLIPHSIAVIYNDVVYLAMFFKFHAPYPTDTVRIPSFLWGLGNHSGVWNVLRHLGEDSDYLLSLKIR